VKLKWSGKRTLIALALLGGVLVLYVLGEDQRREAGRDGGSSPASNSSQCRVEATVDGLNVRSAPNLNQSSIVGKLNLGDESDAQKVVENGFRKLAEDRWVKVEMIKPLEGRDC
jgi:hypothetical protein